MFGRDHPTGARILRRWRELTGGRRTPDSGRRTLVACSGGADSVALAAVLSSITPAPVLGHVVHDLREPALALADRDAVAALARQLGCPFVERQVQVVPVAGNREANARAARYRALCGMAQDAGCPYLATGHHGDDQLETILMHLMRGTGVRGMRGVSQTRRQGTTTIVRPMLEITRAQIEQLCTQGGLAWRHDHTNDDHGYLRNRIRHTLVPVMRQIEPQIAQRAASLAASCAQISDMLTEQVSARLLPLAQTDSQPTGQRAPAPWSWAREQLRAEPPPLLAELLRLYADRELGASGADTMGRRSIGACVDAIRSTSTDPTTHRVGPMIVRVTAHRVEIEPAERPRALGEPHSDERRGKSRD